MPAGTTPPVLRNRSSRLAAGPCSTSFSSSMPGDPMTSFARSTSETPGSCTRIWSAPCCAMLGSVTPSSFTRRSIVCRACTTASSRSVCAMFGRMRNVWLPPVPGLRSKSTPSCSAAWRNACSCAGRHTVDAERRRILNRDGCRHAAALQLFLQPPAVLFGLHPQRIVGLDAQHEVHAALEVEAELQLAIEQPLRRRQVVAHRENRIDADPEKHDEDDEKGDELPA